MGHCGLLSSHDDWSVEQYLPAEAAMVTQMRDPVSRVLSAYEFSVEVASRVLTRSKDYKPDPAKVNTRNVWPWSILVPLIETDMLARVPPSLLRPAPCTVRTDGLIMLVCAIQPLLSLLSHLTSSERQLFIIGFCSTLVPFLFCISSAILRCSCQHFACHAVHRLQQSVR